MKLPTGDEKNPIVIGRIALPRPHAPTVVVYGHYDVQPALEVSKGVYSLLGICLTQSIYLHCEHVRQSEWKSSPWQLVASDGYLYGRGVTDDKGPILATLYAVHELLVKRCLWE